jgi:hypothetical protein
MAHCCKGVGCRINGNHDSIFSDALNRRFRQSGDRDFRHCLYMAACLKWRGRPLTGIEIVSQLPKLELMRKLLQFIQSDAKLPVFYQIGAQTS